MKSLKKLILTKDHANNRGTKSKGANKVKISLKERLFKSSIKTKMIGLMGAIMLIVCVGMGMISYNISYQALISNTDNILPQMATEAALLIESKIEGNFEKLEMIARSVNDTKLTEDQKISKLKDQEIRGGYLMLGIADQKGQLTTSRKKALDIKDADFFQKALAGDMVVTDPTDIFGGSSIVYAVPIKLGNNVQSVLIASTYGNELSDLINSITIGKTGSAFMINEKGVIIAHSNLSLFFDKTNYILEAEKDKSFKELAQVLTLMKAGDVGTGQYTYYGIDRYCGYAPVESTGWFVAVDDTRSEILSGLNPLLKTSIVFTLVFVLIGIMTIFVISNNLTGSLSVIVKNISVMANGDMTQEVPEKYLQKKDEIGVLASSLMTMQSFIRDMINNMKDSSSNIDNQSKNLFEVSQEMTRASDQVTSAIQAVAKGAGAQAEDLSKMLESINQFSSELNKIVKAISDIDKTGNNISSMSEDSRNNMQTLVKSSNLINESFQDFINKIKNFEANVKQINEIANFINNIADQTNLLALNAAIEAARAGESGRGFAVVADHIRKLAEQTKTSSVNINTIIKGVTVETETMVKTTGSLEEEIDNQVSILNTTRESFEMINRAINVVVPEIESVNSSAISLEREKSEIFERIEGVASIAEEVSASAQEIAASSEEMNASMDEVASASDVLTHKTKDMMEQVDKFKL